MKKTVKRLMGIILAFAMMFSLKMPVLAEETGIIQGDTFLYAPPAGTFSIVPYRLLEADGVESVRNAVWSMNTTIPGVRLNSRTGEIILSGSEMESSASFVLTATTSAGSISKTITIPDYRIYENFENQTEGSKVEVFGKTYAGEDSGANLHNILVQVKEEGDGNKYASNTLTTDGSGTPYQGLNFRWGVRYSATGAPVTGTVTAGFRMYIENSEHQIKEGNGDSLYLRIGTSGLKHISGTSTELVTVNGTALSNGWADVYIVTDYYKHKYTVYINGEPVLVDADMPNENSNYQTISSLFIYSSIDDVTYFSGAPTPAEIVSDLPESIAVGSKGVKLPVSTALKIGEDEFDSEIQWESTSGDVSVYNGYLIVDPNAAGNVILTSKTGSVKNDFILKIEEAIEKDYSNEENGYLEGDAVIDASTAEGIYTVKARVKGTDTVLKGISSDIPLFCGDSEFSDLHIFIDTRDNSYTVISNYKTVGKGEYSSLGDITISGGMVDDLYCGNIYDEAPIVADVVISGRTVVGQSISLSYNYYSFLYEKESQSVVWYLDGEEEKNGDNLLLDNTMIGKKVSGILTASGGGKNSTPVSSIPVEIADMYSIKKTAQGVNISVIGTGDELSFIVAAAWIKDGKTEKITAKKLTSYDVNISLSLAQPEAVMADGVRVWLMNSDLSALALPKYDGVSKDTYESAGLTEKGVKYENGMLSVYDSTGQMVTVIIYNPLTENNFVASNTNISASRYDTDWSDNLCYMNTVNANAKIPVFPKRNGFYTVKALYADGTEKESSFIYCADALFTNDILKTLSESDFAAVMQNCKIASDEEDGKKLYTSFLKANPSSVNTIMQGEEYDLGELETAIILSSYLKDKENKKALTDNLTSRTLSTEGTELLAKNLDFARSAALVKIDGGIEKALESMLETAILQGIKYSGNYLETKPYLEAAGDYSVSDNMALDFTAKTYNSLAELKTAIEGYTEPSSGGESSDVGSADGNGGTLSGSSPAGGIFGGSGSSAQKENNKTEEKPQSGTTIFSDVSSEHWAYTDISYLVEKKILSGIGDGSFAPEKSITRAQYVKILAEAFPITETADSVDFSDVDKSAWYYSYIKDASAAGIITGDGNNFRPNDSITRQDAAVMLYRVLKNLNVPMEETDNTASDSADISTYALKAVNSLYNAGIISGMEDGSFRPKTNITRAQAAAIVARVLR